MPFSVEPSALDGYARQIGRAGDDAARIKSYLEGFKVDDGWDGTLIELVGSAHVKAMDAARQVSAAVSSSLQASGNALTSTGAYYRHTDEASAARLDATLPGECTTNPTSLEQRWHDNPCGPGFGDSREPTGRLKPVDDVSYTDPMSIFDNISPSAWALKAFDAIFHFNPLDKVTDFFIGDWQAVAKGGRALGNAADAFDDLAYNVQGGAIELHTTWQGQAADAAYGHFTDTATAIDDLRSPLTEISKQFDTIAQGVYGASSAISGFIKGMLDSATIAGIAFAAGTITVESGVGAIVGYGVAALEIAEILDLWAKATAAMSAIYEAVQLGLGFIESQLAFLYEAQLPDAARYQAYVSPVAGR